MTNSQPDVIFIVLDTQRADRLGCYGYDRQISPNLDAFANEGVLFERAVSPAQWTIPSHASFFTGLYPTEHQVTQSSMGLSPDLPHVAELMQKSGYETVAFCNNPLVGVLNNGFKRGFDMFYNYGGAVPTLPHDGNRFPKPLDFLFELYTQFLRRISYPIQNYVAKSDLALRLSLNSWATPLWSKMANFKGQNARSVRDVINILQQREKRPNKKPLFLFLNLMETHLPFWPPGEFIDQVAPYFRNSKEARSIIQAWNREAYRWAAPLAKPLGELEAKVLSDMYDAEVAYQDDYLGGLFEMLNGRSNHQNTLTVVASDHGDGLGEHGYFGHAFVAYDELTHVPMVMQWPRRFRKPQRVSQPVSTRRIFHTLLDAAGQLPLDVPNFNPVEAHNLSLIHTVRGKDPEGETAFSEIYPPLNFVQVIERHSPELLESHRCLALRRAVVRREAEGVHKLIQVDQKGEELYNLATDRLEEENLVEKRPLISQMLNQQVGEMTETAEKRRDSIAEGVNIDIDNDQHLLQQLRGLGYIE